MGGGFGKASLADVGSVLRARLRGRGLVPGFLVVGARRCGTTALMHAIQAHPDVVRNRTGKGTHYFDVNHDRGWGWYRSCFPKGDGVRTLTGDASPYYMFHPLAPAWIAEELPEARLIAILRDPVDRAWSHYQFSVRKGFEPCSFAEAIAREDERLAGEAERLREDPKYRAFSYRHHSYLARGRYVEQLEDLLELFPADHLLVLQTEALSHRPTDEMGRVWDFLGLPRHEVPVRREKAASYAPMDPVVRQQLAEYFEPYNQRLYELPLVGFRWPGPASRQHTTERTA